jgi:ribose transport system ATP-binding protein
MEATPLLELESVTKDFDAVRAVDAVSLAFRGGEVHGVIGENGAGKSTLMKVVAGVHRADGGRVRVGGREVSFGSAREALAAGIVMIHQEFNLVDELSIAENVFLGREPGRRGVLHRGPMRSAARAALARLGVSLDPDRRIATLSTAECQLVEIAKALTQDTRVLIMDEPTAVLTPRESGALHAIIRQLRDAGVLVILISHRLEEVLRVCDRITVLRDGRFVKTVTPRETSERELAEAMVGRPIDDQFPGVPACAEGGPDALEVRSLSIPGLLEGISFSVGRGEILGLAGLIGAGRTELGEAIVGLRGPHAGSVRVDGREVRIRGVREATAAGIAYLSEDRKGRALTLGMDVAANTTMVSLGRYCRAGFIDGRREVSAAMNHGRSLGIRMSSARQRVETLSGGNQQKVAIAKWLEASPRVLILDEPTRGVDVGAKREIYGLIARLAAEGRGCLFISSEMPELLGMCHRILVMRGGRIAGILGRGEASQERIMYLAAGVQQGPGGVGGGGVVERVTA